MKPKVNMSVYVVTAIPHDNNVLPYTVGVFTQEDTANDAAEIEKTITNRTVLTDISKHVCNQIDASKYVIYEDMKESN